jgi:hypothetical protein
MIVEITKTYNQTPLRTTTYLLWTATAVLTDR